MLKSSKYDAVDEKTTLNASLFTHVIAVLETWSLGSAAVERLLAQTDEPATPAAVPIRDPEIAQIFCDFSKDNLAVLASAFQGKLPEAESYLDAIAEEARTEARSFALDPEPLLTLVEHTRQLSRR
jgi:hypothetical protein